MSGTMVPAALIVSLWLWPGLANAQGRASESPENYRIESVLSLTPEVHGLKGQLQVLVDRTLPADLRDYSPNDDTLPHRPALLRILDTTGKVLLLDTLPRPVAWMDSGILLQPDPQWHAITVDYSTGMGSYNGPVTSFLRVRGPRIEWLEAVDGSNKHRIELLRSLKTDWRIHQGSQACIYVVACRPTSEHDGQVNFEITYVRYFKEGDHWERAQKSERGFWELEDPESFPSDSCFNF